jgi:hypothetical protein
MVKNIIWIKWFFKENIRMARDTATVKIIMRAGNLNSKDNMLRERETVVAKNIMKAGNLNSKENMFAKNVMGTVKNITKMVNIYIKDTFARDTSTKENGLRNQGHMVLVCATVSVGTTKKNIPKKIYLINIRNF